MTAASLWLIVVASGIYHGVNPAMGWPLAVSAGLMGGGRRALAGALALLTIGHLCAMAAILLPFTLLVSIARWQQPIRLVAGLLVAAFGLWLLIRRRHPRIIARIAPRQLALWSFAVATAHGAGLMLVPIYLGLCRTQALERGHQAASTLMAGNLATAAGVALVHTTAMILSGAIVALLVHDWLGLKFLSRTWFNLEALWASSLVVVGGVALAQAGLAG